MNKDAEHLKLLSVFHYVVAGLGAMISCFPLIHLVLGVMMVTGKFNTGKDAPPPEFGWLFIVIAVAVILMGWTASACLAYAGRCIARREKYMFVMVMAAIICLACSPFGTVLGVFTIVVLVRPSVKTLFGQPA